MKKDVIIALSIAVVILGGAFILIYQKNTISDGGAGNQSMKANNVSIVDGTQIIEIRARGGYQPRTSVAQAGIPTIIRFDTNGTFDCSASVRIPSLKISKLLPQSGSTDIDIGTSTAGTLQGMCGMGMYPFEIDFQ